MNPDNFSATYVETDDDGKKRFNQIPCPFLHCNKCIYYESRPADCTSYPHLHKKEFVFRLIGVINNYSICPIVFNVYEELRYKLKSEFNKFLDEIGEG